MTELTFLIELLLNHKLPKATKDAIATRIKEVESAVDTKPKGVMEPHDLFQTYDPRSARFQTYDPLPKPTFSIRAPQESVAPTMPSVIAQTPAAAAALASREQAINQALSGAPEKGRASPRKF